MCVKRGFYDVVGVLRVKLFIVSDHSDLAGVTRYGYLIEQTRDHDANLFSLILRNSFSTRSVFNCARLQARFHKPVVPFLRLLFCRQDSSIRDSYLVPCINPTQKALKLHNFCTT